MEIVKCKNFELEIIRAENKKGPFPALLVVEWE
jgi:hypothetical protein